MTNTTQHTKHFIIQRSELEGRIDPKSYTPERLVFYKKLRNKESTVKLKEVIEKGSYGVLPPDDSYNPDLSIKFIRATELKEDLKIGFKNVHYVSDNYYSERVAIHKNDILMAVKGATIGSNKSVSFVNEEPERSIFNGSIFRIRVNNKKTIPRYIAYLLSSDLLKKQMKYNLVANNAVDYLDKYLIYNLLIPLPDFPTQQKIVNLYQTAYNTKQQREQEAKQLLDSIDTYLLNELGITIPQKDNSLESRIFTVNFSEVSGDRIDPSFHSYYLPLSSGHYLTTALKEIALLNHGWSKLENDNQVSFIPMDAINDEYGIIEQNIADLTAKNKGYTLFEEGDILWAKITPCMQNGKSAIARNLINGKGFGSTEFYVLRCSGRINNEYLLAILRLKKLRKAAMSYFGGATGHQRVSPKFLRELEIPLPPIEKQTEIANHISELRNRAKQLQEEAKEILNEAKATIENMILN